MFQGHRRMTPYGVKESKGKYVLDDYDYSRKSTRAHTIRRWKRNLKKKARACRRRMLNKEMQEV